MHMGGQGSSTVCVSHVQYTAVHRQSYFTGRRKLNQVDILSVASNAIVMGSILQEKKQKNQ